MAVTTKVISSVLQKYKLQCSIRPRVFATTIMNVADTVEKPVPMMRASRREYLPSRYTRFVISSASE